MSKVYVVKTIVRDVHGEIKDVGIDTRYYTSMEEVMNRARHFVTILAAFGRENKDVALQEIDNVKEVAEVIVDDDDDLLFARISITTLYTTETKGR